MDNWQFYTIGGEPRLSSEEALAYALKALRNFSYGMGGGWVVSKFKIATSGDPIRTSLSYLNFQSQNLTRGGDSLTLYPSWWVGIGFDRAYPGGVPGVTASV